MGNIRTKDIKKVSFELVKMYPERFNADFENNKKSVNELKLTDTKLLRNKVAGYVTRIARRIRTPSSPRFPEPSQDRF